MTIRPTPRRFGQDDLDDVFSAIIPPTDAATADKLKTNVKPKKMDPLQRRLSMSAQKRNEVRDTENGESRCTHLIKYTYFNLCI